MSRGGMRGGLKRLAKLGAERVVLEVGGQSAWVSRMAGDMGLKAVVATPRRVRLITHDVWKTDQRDARILADMGQIRPELLNPIEHRGEQTQRDLMVLRTRANLVEGRTALVNEVRHRLKSLGVQIPKCKERYPETRLLRQVQGVGPITALHFVLTLECPDRIDKVRNVGAYLGLVPRRRQSGDTDPDLRITKAGDRPLRCLLVNCAHYILGPFGQDSDLRRHGTRIAGSGGKTAKKRAVVAVARKLAVLLLSLWRTGEVYEPLRNNQRLEAQAS